MLTYTLHAVGSTGNTRAYIRNLQDMTRGEIEFKIEAVGATPTVSFVVQGLNIGGDPTVDADWSTLALGVADATTASSTTAVTVTAVGKTRRFIDGLDKRFFDAIGILTSANTNVTFSSYLNRADRA